MSIAQLKHLKFLSKLPGKTSSQIGTKKWNNAEVRNALAILKEF